MEMSWQEAWEKPQFNGIGLGQLLFDDPRTLEAVKQGTEVLVCR